MYENSVISQGKLDFTFGKQYNHNPYPRDEEESFLWEAGWKIQSLRHYKAYGRVRPGETGELRHISRLASGPGY